MELPFGKKVQCGNFYVLKHMRTLSRKELAKLRQELPVDIKKRLDRGGLPHITVGTVSDSWKITFCIGVGPYNAIDEIPVIADSDGNLSYQQDYQLDLSRIITGWFCYTATVGDAEYQAKIILAMQEYLNRQGDANKEPLSEKENEQVLNEEECRQRHLDTLLKMADEIKKEDENGE